MCNSKLYLLLVWMCILAQASCANQECQTLHTEVLLGDTVEIGYVDADGRKCGKWVHYYRNGNKRAEGIFEDGKMVDHWKHYHESGVLSSTGSYEKIRPVVTDTVYNSDGEVDYLITELSDIKVGVWETYNKEGELIEKIEYNNQGEIIEKND